MANTLQLHTFANEDALDKALAADVAAMLRKALQERSKATLVVSGGRTPLGFMRHLSQQILDWAAVTVTLADERFVAESDPLSNAGLVKANLLRDRASKAEFIPLYYGPSDPTASAARATEALAHLHGAFDVVVLGMGDDGHAASIFPHSVQREAALRDATQRACIAVEGGDPVFDRLTLTAPRLTRARHIVLHITGEHKWNLLGRVMAAPSNPDLPIGALLDTHCESKNVYWTR